MSAAAPEHEIAYDPTGDVASAAVVHVGCVVSTDASSPFANPVIVAENDGFAAPYARDSLLPVTMSEAWVTVNVAAV